MPPPRRAWTGSLAVALGLCASMAVRAGGLDDQPCAPPLRPDHLLDATVRRVIDGDTVVVRRANGRLERVRLVGIDTPEVHESQTLAREIARSGRDAATVQRLGRRAATFTAALLPVSRRIALELDIQPRDQEGRLLAYVWRDDGVLVNLALLEAGQARLLTIPPNVRHADRFRACTVAARAARRGLWASADGRAR
jgi:micrococcal nuclease